MNQKLGEHPVGLSHRGHESICVPNQITKLSSWVHQFSESQTKVPWSVITLKIVTFIRFCTVDGQGFQLICHTKLQIFKMMVFRGTLVHDSENWSKIQIFKMMVLRGPWLWELVRWPALSNGIFIFVFGAKLFRSCMSVIKVYVCWVTCKRRGYKDLSSTLTHKNIQVHPSPLGWVPTVVY